MIELCLQLHDFQQRITPSETVSGAGTAFIFYFHLEKDIVKDSLCCILCEQSVILDLEKAPVERSGIKTIQIHHLETWSQISKQFLQ